MTSALIRTQGIGDLTAAIVLGTIGQYNQRRDYAEVGEAEFDLDTLITSWGAAHEILRLVEKRSSK